MRIFVDESRLGLISNDVNKDIISDIKLFNNVLVDIEKQDITNIDKFKDKEIIILNYELNNAGDVSKIKNIYPDKDIVVLLGFNIYPDLFTLTLNEQNLIINDIKLSDGVMTTGKPEYRYFKFINDNIEYLGIPFDMNVDLTKYSKKVNENLIGVKSNNLIFLPVLDKIKNEFWADLKYKNVYGDTVEEFYSEMSDCKYIINLNFNYTFGRIVGESALMNKVCIGNENNDLQNILFPQTSINAIDMNGLYMILKNLYTNKSYYDTLIGYAKCRLNDYNFKVIKRRFFDNIVKLLG